MRTLICVALLLVTTSVFAVNERPGSRFFKNPVRVLEKLYEQHLEAQAVADPRADSSTSSGVGNACGNSGASGTCINTDNTNCNNGVLQPDLCPGGSNIECCLTDWGACSGGECITTAACAAEGGTSTPGECPGPDNVQCCSSGGPAPSGWNTSMAYQVALTWLKYSVQYNWTPNVDQWVTSGQGPYRSDCSGFVSAAWNEPPPGYVTSDFPCYQIDASDLQLGDALLNPSEHVALFIGWNSNGQPIVVEECGHTPSCCGGDATCPGSCGSSSNDCDEYCPGCPIQLHTWPEIYSGFYPCRRNGW